MLKRFLHDHKIEHVLRMVENPDVKVDALMLNIYSTPAMVVADMVLHQPDLFTNGSLNEAKLLSLLERD